MAIEYKCTKCGEMPGRELLTCKKVVFQGIGMNAKISKTRTESWLCPTCTARDPQWNLQPFEAPGVAGTTKAATHAAPR